MPSYWHIQDLHDTHQSPIAFRDMARLIADGELQAESLVARVGPRDVPAWQRADSVVGLFRMARQLESSMTTAGETSVPPATRAEFATAEIVLPDTRLSHESRPARPAGRCGSDRVQRTVDRTRIAAGITLCMAAVTVLTWQYWQRPVRFPGTMLGSHVVAGFSIPVIGRVTPIEGWLLAIDSLVFAGVVVRFLRRVHINGQRP